MAAPRVQWPTVQRVLSGQPTSQVTVAQYLVNIGDVHGGVVNVAPRGHRLPDLVRPRARPASILPRRAPRFLDREQEQGLVGRALARGLVLDLHGPDGIGKTALIAQSMHSQLPSAFPAGQIYLTARNETREDLLQSLFECFFESRDHVRITGNDVRRYMAGKRALIAVDDADDLQEGEAEALSQVVPDSALLIAGRRQQVWQGAAVKLSGLPRSDAVALFAQHWGPLSAPERPIVEAIAEALDGAPRATIQLATAARQHPERFSEVLRRLQPATGKSDPTELAFQAVAALLSEGERRVLGGLAATGAGSASLEALADITQIEAASLGQQLARLQAMGLVQVDKSRPYLDDTFRPHIRDAWADEGMRKRAAEYFGARAGQLRPRSKDPDEENVLAALQYYRQHRAWQQVIHIARALERYLAAAGRWGQWRRVLLSAWQAAQESDDKATEAWCHNQLGIIALGADDLSAAIGRFREALGLWQALGDGDGMTIAHWNLQVLLGPPPPPPREGKAPARPGGGTSGLIVALASTAAILTVVLGLLIFLALPRPTPTPLPPELPAPVVEPTQEQVPPTTEPQPTSTQPLPAATIRPRPVVATPVPVPIPLILDQLEKLLPLIPGPVQGCPPIELIKPEDEASLSRPTTFRWRWDGALAKDHFFDLRVWREGAPHYGVAWSKQQEHLYDPCAVGSGLYFWSVAVIQGQDGRWLADVCPEAEPWRFTCGTYDKSPLPTPEKTAEPTDEY